MEKKYSIYEARAKFSELVRTVLATGSALITQRGKPVIRVIPYQASPADFEERLTHLAQVGKARLATSHFCDLLDATKGLQVKPGAVQRFLKERD